MKRFFFTTIALAAVAVSCTKGGLIESPKTYEDPITFEPYTGKDLMTKASVLGDSYIQSNGFHVVGFEEASGSTVINPNSAWLDKVVTDTDQNNEWEYEGAMYWSNSDLTFVAYAPVQHDNITYPVNGDYTKLTYEVDTDVANQIDLVLSPVKQNCSSAKPNGPDSEEKTVAVKLYHALSRIGFTLKTQEVTPKTGSTTTAPAVTIKSITLNGKFITKATFILSKITAPISPAKTLAYYTEEDEEAGIGEDDINLLVDAYAVQSYSLMGTNKYFSTADADPKITTPATQSDPFTYKTYPIYSNKASDGDGGSVAFTPSEADRYIMIIPGIVGNVSEANGDTSAVKPNIQVTYNIDGQDGDQSVTIDLPDGWEFATGKAYEFVFTVSTVAVGFDVNVNIWDPTNGSTTDPETVPIPVTVPIN